MFFKMIRDSVKSSPSSITNSNSSSPNPSFSNKLPSSSIAVYLTEAGANHKSGNHFVIINKSFTNVSATNIQAKLEKVFMYISKEK